MSCVTPAATLSLGVERSGHIRPQSTRPKCRRSTTGLRGNTAYLWLVTENRLNNNRCPFRKEICPPGKLIIWLKLWYCQYTENAVYWQFFFACNAEATAYLVRMSEAWSAGGDAALCKKGR